jgi:hypothetical protein
MATFLGTHLGTTQCHHLRTTSYEAVVLRPPQESREATPSSGNEACGEVLGDRCRVAWSRLMNDGHVTSFWGARWYSAPLQGNVLR